MQWVTLLLITMFEKCDRLLILKLSEFFIRVHNDFLLKFISVENSSSAVKNEHIAFLLQVFDVIAYI